MRLIDTHAHIYLEHFNADREAMIARAREVLDHVFLPNIDLASIAAMNALADLDRTFFHPMMGLHPCSVDTGWRDVIAAMEAEWAGGDYVAVGECGLDYYWDKTHVAEQKQALEVQLGWGKEMNLAVILHCRDSMDDVIAQVRAAQDGRLRGIFHCFTGDARQAREIIDLGFMLGIGGVLTYKNSDLPAVLAGVPLDAIVLETDAPYLAPVPHRGKRNESSYVAHVARRLAEVLDVTPAAVAEATSANALRMFGGKNGRKG